MMTDTTTSIESMNFTVKKVASKLQFTEGPVWHPNGFLLFSDIPANKIYRLFPDTGELDIYINDSGLIGNDTSLLSKQIGSNGIIIDKNQNIIFCQHGNHAIACLNTNNELKFLTCMFDGRPYNSPNDLVMKSDGSIYFSDPPYGLKDETLNEKLFQPWSGVYRYRSGMVELLTKELARPNGLCFSPGETHLYISNTDKDNPRVHRFRVGDEGKISEEEVFVEMHVDGMHCDEHGNLFCAGMDGIYIFSSQGEKINKIDMPGMTSNIVAAPGGRYYVTAGDSVYVLDPVNE
jgi:gluconolactonase